MHHALYTPFHLDKRIEGKHRPQNEEIDDTIVLHPRNDVKICYILKENCKKNDKKTNKTIGMIKQENKMGSKMVLWTPDKPI